MTILFQGDSITDAGRQNRESPKPNDQISMGNGYASMATSALLASRPSLNLTIFNRGISVIKYINSMQGGNATALTTSLISLAF